MTKGRPAEPADITMHANRADESIFATAPTWAEGRVESCLYQSFRCINLPQEETAKAYLWVVPFDKPVHKLWKALRLDGVAYLLCQHLCVCHIVVGHQVCRKWQALGDKVVQICTGVALACHAPTLIIQWPASNDSMK